MKELIIFLAAIVLSTATLAQKTIILQPDSDQGKDAYLRRLDPTVNRATDPTITARAGTNGGVENLIRGIFEFDLFEIPFGSTVTDATLSLYSAPEGEHRLTDGENDCYLSRVIEEWNEEEVTWDNQPQTIAKNKVYLPNSTTENQDYLIINVAAIVQDMVDDPDNSHGFLFQQVTETIYRTMLFASSDNENASLRPKLLVTYLEPTISDVCVTFNNGTENGKDAYLRSLDPEVNRSNHPDLIARTGTNSGQVNIVRGVFDFDLKSLPTNINIVSSILTLYSFDSPSNGSHVAYDGGNNQAEIRRIIEDWDEETVTWNNQPDVIDQNMEVLLETTNSIQDYSINMKELVSDYLDDRENSFGFMMKLSSEEPYGSLVFGSSDNSDSLLWPKLEVCFNIETATVENVEDFKFDVYPNPSAEFLTIKLNDFANKKMSIYSMDGYEVMTRGVTSARESINISQFPNGEYLIELSDGKKRTSKLFTKI